MKIRFYSIKDLYEEVKDFIDEIVRMQFLERTYSAEFKGAGTTFHQLTTEQILTVSVQRELVDAWGGSGEIYYYSQPYFRCMKFDLKDKATEIDEKQKGLETKIKETFKGWTVRKGIYEIE